MRRVRAFPREVREIENLWIPLSDGCRLAARAWLPADAEERPAPAVVEYLPYRKRDGTRARDEAMHRWFAGHGYAALRIDLRGSGDSDGLLLDEYLEREQTDGVEAIAWIAAQPWCTGAVGMIGKSWGGFNALQIAARRPPELRAIVTVCSADDRYADDAHYMGGCLLNENLVWGSVLLTIAALPPDPAVVGDAWRARWLERLEALPLFPALWLEHQRRDAYWRQGSVCEDYGAIACPVYAVGGWADGYSNAVPRLLAGLRVPRRGLVGPWAHTYPHDGIPGPAIGFLQEALAWWERWLRDAPSPAAADDEPAYRAWMQESAPPLPLFAHRPGRWVAEEGWPSARVESRALALARGRLLAPGEAPPDDAPGLVLRSPQTAGLEGGSWCGFGVEGEAPGDQRPDDALSLVFDSAPLSERVELLGAPVVELELASDRPLALVAARLCEVLADGTSARLTYGLRNLAHRDGHEEPRPLEPGRRCRVRVPLNDLAHALPAGAVLRLALSTAYWPIAWPSPEPVTLTVFPSGCRLLLPVRPPRAEDEALRPFPPPEAAAASPVVPLAPAPSLRRVERDLATGETVLTVVMDADEAGAPVLERVEAIDLVQGHGMVARFRIRPDDPLSARAEVEHRATLRRGAWATDVETRVALRATREAFLLEGELRAREGAAEVAARRWRRSIPRDGL